MKMMMRGDGRGLVTSHSDSKLRAVGEDVQIQLSCDSLAQLRRQQASHRPHLTTFHCLHPPTPTPPLLTSPASKGEQSDKKNPRDSVFAS